MTTGNRPHKWNLMSAEAHEWKNGNLTKISMISSSIFHQVSRWCGNSGFTKEVGHIAKGRVWVWGGGGGLSVLQFFCPVSSAHVEPYKCNHPELHVKSHVEVYSLWNLFSGVYRVADHPVSPWQGSSHMISYLFNAEPCLELQVCKSMIYYYWVCILSPHAIAIQQYQ